MKVRPHVVIATIVVDHVVHAMMVAVVVVMAVVKVAVIVLPQHPHPQPLKPEFPFNLLLSKED